MSDDSTEVSATRPIELGPLRRHLRKPDHGHRTRREFLMGCSMSMRAMGVPFDRIADAIADILPRKDPTHIHAIPPKLAIMLVRRGIKLLKKYHVSLGVQGGRFSTLIEINGVTGGEAARRAVMMTPGRLEWSNIEGRRVRWEQVQGPMVVLRVRKVVDQDS